MKKIFIFVCISIFYTTSMFSKEPAKLYVGCIFKLSGKVEVYSANKDKWLPAYQYMPVEENDKVKTYKKAFCDIVLQDGSVLRLSEETEISIKSLQLINKKQKYSFDIKSGRTLGLLNKLSTSDSSMKIFTPTAVMSVRGTDFALDVSSDITNVGLFEGELSIKTYTAEEHIEEPSEEVILTPDKEAIIEKAKKPKVEERLSKFMEKEKQRWLKVKAYVEGIRKKLKERETYLQDCIRKQEEKLKELKIRQKERLKQLEERRKKRLKKPE